MDDNRRQMLENYEIIIRRENGQIQFRKTEGQMSLFGEAEISSDGELKIPQWKITLRHSYCRWRKKQWECIFPVIRWIHCNGFRT